jgi:N-acetylglucosamine-6-phosphate deacetylase
VIIDGVHVHPAMLHLLLAAKPAGRIILVSDAMPPAGTAITEFQLQGRRILRAAGRLVTEAGTLAGADICLADAVRGAVRLGLTPAQALTMATANPADFLRLGDRVGRIAPGLRADLVLLTRDLEVRGTWLGGAWQGEAGIIPASVAA